MADNKAVVDRLLGEISYKGDVYENALPVAYTLVNRAKATGTDVEAVSSPQSQINAQKPAKGSEKYRKTVEKALNDAMSGAVPDPTKGATFYATPATFKNLPSGLSKTVTVGGHTFATDPQNRALVTADGVKSVDPNWSKQKPSLGSYFSDLAPNLMDYAKPTPNPDFHPVPTPTARPAEQSAFTNTAGIDESEGDFASPISQARRTMDLAQSNMDNFAPRVVKTTSIGPDPRDAAEQNFAAPTLSPQDLIDRAFGIVDADPITDRVASAWGMVPGDGKSKLVSMVDGKPALREGYTPSTKSAPNPNELVDAAWSVLPQAPKTVQTVDFKVPTQPKTDWDMPQDLIQATARSKQALGLTAPSSDNMLPATRQSGQALGASTSLTPASPQQWNTQPDRPSTPAYSAPSPSPFSGYTPARSSGNSSSYGDEDAGGRDVISSYGNGDGAPGTNTSATYSPTQSVSPMASQRQSVQQYADQVSYVDVPNPAYTPGVPSQEIIDQMMNLPTDWNPEFPTPEAPLVPATIKKKVVTKVPTGFSSYKAPAQPTLSREQEQVYGNSGYASGQSWRNTRDGGAKNFSPTTSRYMNYGGSNAGGVSSNQSTGKGGSFATISAIADKVASDFGGGGSSGGGKIVCTAMNDAYGFGGFRNAIWLRYARDHLTPAHQTGYHALFRPLVKFAYHAPDATGVSRKARLWVRSCLEHIARERTADLWAQMRGGPRRARGRIYRAVLEPLCFVVGSVLRLL